jgi:ABC-type dipeptide/oligopeptide/nickel transport system permease subunit
VNFKYLGIATFPWDYSRNPGVDGIRVQYNSLPRTTSRAPGYQPVANYDLGETTGAYMQGPSTDYWFGTTMFGQDVFAQFVHGLRSS